MSRPAEGFRVYVPSTIGRLRASVRAGGIGPAPVLAHAVTEDLRSAWPEGSLEDWEYAASSAAASSALGLLGPDDVQRRVVVAADVPAVVPLTSGDPTTVEVHDVIPLRMVAAVLVDAETADAEQELGWYATQEIDGLLSDLGPAGGA